jgi:hypothetical protein
VNGWFDQTIDRVSERFTYSTRLVTFAGSLIVALALQLDTAALVNRLSTDPALRQAVVEQALRIDRQAPPGTQTAATGVIPALSPQDRENLQELVRNDLLEFPQSLGDWAGRWSAENWPLKLLGILLTAMLLSLGAPFWYNALKNLVRLRSLIASKDDSQRVERQSTQVTAAAAGAGTGGSSVPTAFVGERGDVASVG